MKPVTLTIIMALFLSPLVPRLDASDIPSNAKALFRDLDSGQSRTVIVYGTSLTHSGAWTKATKQWFDEQYPGKVTFINSGGPGQNSDWGLSSLKSKVLDHHPDLIFVEFSYNDAHEKFTMPIERGAANLKKIVDAIRAQNAGTVIVLQTMNVGWDAPNGKRSLSSRPDLNLHNENYRNLARIEKLPLLDHCASWLQLKESDPGKFQKYVPDGTHPSSEGSLAVTWPNIKTWLEAARTSGAGQVK